MSNVTPPHLRRTISARVGGEVMTEQQHRDHVDIHQILKRFDKTGILDHTVQFEGKYGDFTTFPDFQEAQFKIREAEEMFLTVPAKIRAQFDNNPGKFIDWITDDANFHQVAELGFSTAHLTEPPAPEPEPEPPGFPDPADQGS